MSAAPVPASPAPAPSPEKLQSNLPTGVWSSPLYPFQGNRFDVGGGIQLHYLDEGPRDGDPVLMVHGNPTWSFYYRNLVTAFRGAYRVIVPDHIGMGLSDKPPESIYEYTLSRRVDDLEKLVDSLNLQKPLTLVVHDWGGMIGMALAARRPERVARIIVLNTGAFGLPAGKKLPWQIRLARTPILGAMLIRGLNAFSAGAVKDCAIKPLSAEVKRGYLAPYDSWKHRLAVHRFIQDIPLRPGDRAYDLVAEVERHLPKFRSVSMLICFGMKDFVFDQHFLARWVDLFPQAEVHRFEQAGHYVVEDAGEEIRVLIEQFLKQHPLGSA